MAPASRNAMRIENNWLSLIYFRSMLFQTEIHYRLFISVVQRVIFIFISFKIQNDSCNVCFKVSFLIMSAEGL